MPSLLDTDYIESIDLRWSEWYGWYPLSEVLSRYDNWIKKETGIYAYAGFKGLVPKKFNRLDKNILYIGQATDNYRKRFDAFYKYLCHGDMMANKHQGAQKISQAGFLPRHMFVAVSLDNDNIQITLKETRLIGLHKEQYGRMPIGNSKTG